MPKAPTPDTLKPSTICPRHPPRFNTLRVTICRPPPKSSLEPYAPQILPASKGNGAGTPGARSVSIQA